MVVDDLRVADLDDRCEVSARVRPQASEQRRLWWRLPAGLAPAEPDGSPFLAGLLVACMREREDLTVDAPVSPRLLDNVQSVVAVLRSLFPARLRPVAVSAPAGLPPPASPTTGCFFSRGVDSWYAVLSAREDDPQVPPLSHLVFSPGFLSTKDTDASVRRTTALTRDAALRTGCAFLAVETNLKREFGGAQLTATALVLGFERMLVASGAMHGEIVPATTHPTLDHRFSTERTEIVHYGDASRVDKIARIARSQDALDTLYVCQLDDPTSARNCGRCEKCVRTMLGLHLAGALPRARTLPDVLDPQVVAGVRRKLGRRQQFVDALHALGDTPVDRELKAAVRLVIAQSDLQRAGDSIDDLSSDPALGDLHPRLPDAARRARELSAAAGLHLRVPPPGRGRARVQTLGRRVAASRLADRVRSSPTARRLARLGTPTR